MRLQIDIIVVLFLTARASSDVILTVDAGQPIGPVSDLLYGIFFEEINHAGDGGLYAEMVQDRAFEQPPQTVPGHLDDFHSLKASFLNETDIFLRHCDFQGLATKINSPLDTMDASFSIVPGLVGGHTVSLRSLNYPMYYLLQKNGMVSLEQFSNDSEFLKNASLTKEPGLADPHNSNMASFSWSSLQGSKLYLSVSTRCTVKCTNFHPCFDQVFSANPDPKRATFEVLPSMVSPSLGWYAVGNATLLVENTHPLTQASPNALHVTCSDDGMSASRCGASNTGYWGMSIKEGESYRIALFASPKDGTQLPKMLTAAFVSRDFSKTLGSCDFELNMKNWTNQTCEISASGSSDTAQLALLLSGPGDLLLDVVSVMPADTPIGRPFRADILEMLKNMHPAFVRFPGGCYVEGDKLADAFRWKPSIGAIEERPGHYDLWGYWSDDGLGFFEYLMLCEELSAEPVWVINNGISHTDEIPTNEIQPWVQDALDSLEFANGPADSPWGAKRAAMGHFAPFDVKYMAIGNEDCGKPNYLGNYIAFYKAIKEQYPKMTLIANCDLSQTNAPMDVYDYHIYTSSTTFFTRVNSWDSYNRSAPKVFNSEYAVTSDAGQGNLRAAVGEAAWMTGLERNSDAVIMASYAPLFVNINDRRWNPDAIVYNVSHVYGTPSYWNQVMFSTHKGKLRHNSTLTSDTHCALQVAASVTSVPSSIDGTTEVIIKTANWGNTTELHVTLENISTSAKVLTGSQSILTGDPQAENSLNSPDIVSPTVHNITSLGQKFSVQLPAWSVNIICLTVSI